MAKRDIPITAIYEDEVIDRLMDWLEVKGWDINGFCKGSKRGIDILACKGNTEFIIEAKGAKGNPNHKSTKKEIFTSGQLHTHLGVAILKVLKEKIKRPGARIGIAHPDDPYIKSVLEPVIAELKKLDIIFYWVHLSGKVSKA